MSHSWYNDNTYPTLPSPHRSGGQPNIKIGTSTIIYNPGSVIACEEYILPIISGSNLSGNEAYYDNSQNNNGNIITGNITSSQTVWIYDYNGSCSDEQSFDVSINNIDNSTSTSNSTISSNMSGVTYNWIDCDNSFSIIPGETQQTFSPQTNGFYAVIVNDGVCLDTSECVAIKSLEINNEFLNSLTVFPNPSNDNITIKIPNCNGNVKASIYDLSGRLIVVETKKIIDIKSFPNGVYNLIVQFENKTKLIKLIKN
jgi:hypothetical protein